MRLINADDLVKTFEALELMSGQYAESFTNMAGNRSMEIASAEDYIDNAKTIDSVPVVHAHWIYGYTFPDGQYRKCSACNELIKAVVNDGNFCGHCGAKMDEVKINGWTRQ